MAPYDYEEFSKVVPYFATQEALHDAKTFGEMMQVKALDLGVMRKRFNMFIEQLSEKKDTFMDYLVKTHGFNAVVADKMGHERAHVYGLYVVIFSITRGTSAKVWSSVDRSNTGMPAEFLKCIAQVEEKYRIQGTGGGAKEQTVLTPSRVCTAFPAITCQAIFAVHHLMKKFDTTIPACLNFIQTPYAPIFLSRIQNGSIKFQLKNFWKMSQSAFHTVAKIKGVMDTERMWLQQEERELIRQEEYACKAIGMIAEKILTNYMKGDAEAGKNEWELPVQWVWSSGVGFRNHDWKKLLHVELVDDEIVKAKGVIDYQTIFKIGTDVIASNNIQPVNATPAPAGVNTKTIDKRAVTFSDIEELSTKPDADVDECGPGFHPTDKPSFSCENWKEVYRTAMSGSKAEVNHMKSCTYQAIRGDTVSYASLCAARKKPEVIDYVQARLRTINHLLITLVENKKNNLTANDSNAVKWLDYYIQKYLSFSKHLNATAQNLQGSKFVVTIPADYKPEEGNEIPEDVQGFSAIIAKEKDQIQSASICPRWDIEETYINYYGHSHSCIVPQLARRLHPLLQFTEQMTVLEYLKFWGEPNESATSVTMVSFPAIKPETMETRMPYAKEKLALEMQPKDWVNFVVKRRLAAYRMRYDIDKTFAEPLAKEVGEMLKKGTFPWSQ